MDFVCTKILTSNGILEYQPMSQTWRRYLLTGWGSTEWVLKIERCSSIACELAWVDMAGVKPAGWGWKQCLLFTSYWLTRASPISQISHTTQLSFGIDTRPRQRKLQFWPCKISHWRQYCSWAPRYYAISDLLSRESHAFKSGLRDIRGNGPCGLV